MSCLKPIIIAGSSQPQAGRLTVDQVLVNRVLPDDVEDAFFREWRRTQSKFLKEIESYFDPVPIRCVP